MTVGNIFFLHGFSTETAANFYSQVTDSTLNTSIEDFTQTPSGHYLPLFTAAGSSRPEISFGTHQVETAIDEFGFLGVDPGNVILRLRKAANRSNRVANATTEHITYTCNSVLAYLSQITAGAHKNAVATGRLALLNDGTNAAYIYSGSAAVSGTPSAGENFILGPIAHNGTAITGCDNLSIDFNVEVVEPEQEIEDEPTFACVDMIKPTISFETTDATVWSLHQSAITNGIKINLYKKQANGSRYSDASTEHILFTIATGRIVCESVGGNRSLTRVKIFSVSSDGTTSPIVAALDNAVDITALA